MRGAACYTAGPAITSNGTNPEITGRCSPTLEQFLRDHNLHRYLDAFKAAGAEEASDLQFMSEDEVMALRGMKPLHARKLLAAAREAKKKDEL